MATPMHITAPISEGTFSRGVSKQEHPADAGQRARERGDNDERIEPGLEIHHNQEVYEHDGHRQPAPRPKNEDFMVVTCPRTVRKVPRGN